MGKYKKKVAAAAGGRKKSNEDGSNHNSNCQAATVSRRRNVNKVDSESENESLTKNKRTKRQKASKSGDTSESEAGGPLSTQSLNANTEKIQFEEDQDRIEFEVVNSGDDFLSDGEVDSEDEDEIQDPPEVQVDLNLSMSSVHSAHTCDSTEDSQGTDTSADNESVRSRPKPRSVVKRHSVEEKLDDLTSALMSMKDIMLKKGLFDEENGELQSKKAKTHRSAGEVSESETTIYHNAVQHQPNSTEEDETEVTFNVKRLR